MPKALPAPNRRPKSPRTLHEAKPDFQTPGSRFFSRGPRRLGLGWELGTVPLPGTDMQACKTGKNSADHLYCVHCTVAAPSVATYKLEYYENEY